MNQNLSSRWKLRNLGFCKGHTELFVNYSLSRTMALERMFTSLWRVDLEMLGRISPIKTKLWEIIFRISINTPLIYVPFSNLFEALL